MSFGLGLADWSSVDCHIKCRETFVAEMFALQTCSFLDFPWRHLFLLLEATFLSTHFWFPFFSRLSLFPNCLATQLISSFNVSYSSMVSVLRKSSRMRMSNFLFYFSSMSSTWMIDMYLLIYLLRICTDITDLFLCLFKIKIKSHFDVDRKTILIDSPLNKLISRLFWRFECVDIANMAEIMILLSIRFYERINESINGWYFNVAEVASYCNLVRLLLCTVTLKDIEPDGS